MRTGARKAKYEFSAYDENLVMNMYDYEYPLALDEIFNKIYKMANDHEYLFNNTSDTVKKAINTRIFNNFKLLASAFFEQDYLNKKRKKRDDGDVENKEIVKLFEQN